jgi:hypothetical protein
MVDKRIGGTQLVQWWKIGHMWLAVQNLYGKTRTFCRLAIGMDIKLEQNYFNAFGV